MFIRTSMMHCNSLKYVIAVFNRKSTWLIFRFENFSFVAQQLQRPR